MNPPVLASLSVSLLVSAAALTSLSTPAVAQAGDAKFSCGMSQGSPATMVQTARGNITVIRWVSKNAFGEDYPPAYRCRIVSAKFQQFYNNGQLNYLTTGIANGQPIICAAKTKGGPCSGVLFTLKRGSDPLNTLTRLMNVRVQAGAPLNESTGSGAPRENGYIDMADFLNTAPVESSVAPPNRGMW